MKKGTTTMKNITLKSVFAAAAVAASQVSQAAVTTIDTSEPVGQIAEGSTAGGVIGLALLCFCILIGVLVKMRRAGQ